MDDNHAIVKNPFIKIDSLSFEEIKEVLAYSHYRWLPDVSFALNYFFGGIDVFGYHLVNLTIHIFTGITFYFLALVTLHLPILTGRFTRPREIALASAIIWLAHPIQTNAVTYIVQRMTSMAALFYLGSMLFYVYGRLEKDSNLKKISCFTACLISGILATASKQNAVMLPIMLFAYDLFFIRQTDWRKDAQKILISLCLAGVAVSFAGWLLTGGNIISIILSGYADWDFTLTERLLTEVRVIFHYLSLLILPIPSRLRLDYDYEISTGLLTPPQTLLSIIALLGLVYLIVIFYRRNRLISFGILWFLGNLVIESTVIPLDLVFEHRLYLPSTFLIFSLTAACFQMNFPINIIRSSLAVVGIFLMLLTWQRNAVWATPFTLWSDVVEKSPHSARGYINLAIDVKKAGKISEAEKLLLKAIEVEPENGVAYFNLAQVYDLQHRYPEAISSLQKALTTPNVNITVVHSLLADIYLESGDYPQAIKEAEITLKRNPKFVRTFITLGRIYEKLGEYQKALSQFEKAETAGLKITYEIYARRGDIYYKQGVFPQAIEEYKQALSANPNLLDLYISLGRAYEAAGRHDKALEQYGKGRARGLDTVYLHMNWAISNLSQDMPEHAVQHLKRVVELEPDNYEAHFALSLAYKRLDKEKEAQEEISICRKLKNK